MYIAKLMLYFANKNGTKYKKLLLDLELVKFALNKFFID